MPLTRRKLVQLCAAGAAALPAHSGAARPDRPNILFLLTDQQRFDCVSRFYVAWRFRLPRVVRAV